MESNERLYGKKVFIVSREEEGNEKCNAIREQAALEIIPMSERKSFLQKYAPVKSVC